jgi:hypothetical protein
MSKMMYIIFPTNEQTILIDRKDKSMLMQKTGTKNQNRSFCGQNDSRVLTIFVASDEDHVTSNVDN